MDKFTQDILISGYSGNNTKVRLFSLTGLSPSLVGRSRAVLLTLGFVTFYFKSYNTRHATYYCYMFHFTGYASRLREITQVYCAGFPHSEISGSKPARRLPEA